MVKQKHSVSLMILQLGDPFPDLIPILARFKYLDSTGSIKFGDDESVDGTMCGDSCGSEKLSGYEVLDDRNSVLYIKRNVEDGCWHIFT